MPYTSIFNYWFADPGTETSKYPEKDRERWEAIEISLLELYTIFGNGVNGEGWRISETVAEGPIIYITPGSGHIGYKFAETTENYPISLFVPTGVDMSVGIQFFVYGYATETTHFDKSIKFEAFTTTQDNLDYIYIGAFTLKLSNGSYVITKPDYDGRDEISIFSSVSNLINKHVHTGNPPKINLRKHTSGKLPGAFIASDLDASQIQTGKMSLDRLPQISHELLSNAGQLTHEQLDTFFINQNLDVDDHLAEVAFANWLQEILAEKLIYIDFDEFFINSFFFIPGITSSSYIDKTGTTAIIDEANHQIVGIEADPSTSDFITWNGYNEFNVVYTADYQSKNANLIVNTDGTITLDRPLRFTTLYNTTVEANNPKHWNTYTEVTTVNSSQSNTISVDAQLHYYRFLRFWSGVGPTAIDMSYMNKIQFGIKLKDPDILNHGKIYFFLIGATHQTLSNKSISYTDSINSTNYTISISGPVQILDYSEQTTDLDNDIKTVNIDLLQFPTRSNVQGFGFYINSEENWNVVDAYEFSLHQPPYDDMDTKVSDDLKIRDPFSLPNEGKIVMYAYNDLYYESSGKIYFRFNQPLTTQWDYLYWDVDIDSVPTGVVAPYLLVKTISASTSTLLPEAIPYLVSDIDHIINSENNKYLDMVVEFRASSDRRYSPILNSLTLYYTIASSLNSKTFSTAADFADALKKLNILIAENPDAIEMEDTNLVNAMFFIENNNIKVIDENKVIVPEMVFDGTSIYESPRQVFAKSGKGFRNAKFLDILDESILIADTQNDRVLEIDFDGNLIRAFQGNIYLYKTARDFVALCGHYNSRLGKIFVSFSQSINSTFDKTKFTLGTVDQSNYFSFLSDDDGIFTTISNSDGKSAVLVITLGAARKQQVDSWTVNKVLYISQGAVTGSAGSTTSSFTPEAIVTANLGNEITILADEEDTVPQVIQNNIPGSTITIYNPGDNTVVETETKDELDTFDFNNDGKVDSSTLMDINGETDIVSVLIEDIDIVYSNIQYPLSVQKSGENNYIIGQDSDFSVLNIGIDENLTWSISNAIVSFDWLKGGNAYFLSDGSVLCSSPSMKKVIQIMPPSNSILFSYSTSFTPVYTLTNSSDNIIIIQNDELYNSLNSRIIEINSNNDVIREWGVGRLSNPNNIYVLPNNNWLIST